jgi:regulatory protein
MTEAAGGMADADATAEGGVVTGLHAQRRNPERVNVHIDGEFCCGAAWEVVYAEGLRVGDAASADAIARIRTADEHWKAKQAALSLLGARPRARRELGDRLRRKGFDADAAEWALTQVERLGFIDDVAFAESWVRDRLRLRPRGARALVAELTRKGVDGDTARSVVERVMRTEQKDDSALCQQAADKWLRTRGRIVAAEPDQHARVARRLAAFLERRGYAGDHIRAALDRIDRPAE